MQRIHLDVIPSLHLTKIALNSYDVLIKGQTALAKGLRILFRQWIPKKGNNHCEFLTVYSFVSWQLIREGHAHCVAAAMKNERYVSKNFAVNFTLAFL